MRNIFSNFKELEKQSLQELFTSQLDNCMPRRYKDSGRLSDPLFIQACLKRVITQNQSGREFLQTLHEIDEKQVARSTFFDALHSSRRLSVIKETSDLYYNHMCRLLSSADVDYLADFPELDEFDLFSADGHFIEHPSHVPKKDDKRIYPAGSIYIQNMRNGLLQFLTPLSDGRSKEHELPHFIKSVEKKNTTRRVIWVADRAYMKNQWWEKQKRKGNFIISRTKSNRSVTYCGEYQFDKEDPVNTGVIRDAFGGFTNTYSTFRVIDYTDPETEEKITFYTTLGSNIRPGVVCWLYFLRWKIEKAFDCFKNALDEKKAWAVGNHALKIQGISICMLYNFIHFLSETIQWEYQCEDKKSEKKYMQTLAKRFERATARGRTIHPLLLFNRNITRISSQFFRAVRNHFSSKKPLYIVIPIFIQRLEAYL